MTTDDLRVLSVRQPWASLIASGRKTIELRTWSTNYRGPVLIIAGCAPWRGDHGFELGPLGRAICVVNLIDCRESTRADQPASCVPEQELRRLTFAEKPLGSKRWFSWLFSEPRAVNLAPVKGKLGLYRPDANLRAVAGFR